MGTPEASILPPQRLVRPFWSVMVPVYNSTKYLARTLESLLSQGIGPDQMQIEVIDGCSSRNLPQDLVKQIAGDRVTNYRHTEPLSMVANWNSCIERARGEWVHILHSDDFVLPGFYSRLQASLECQASAGAAFTCVTNVDADGRIIETRERLMQTSGVLPDQLDRMASRQIVSFPSMVVRKSAYEAVGGFRSDLCFAVDWEMWVRLAARYPIWYEPEPRVCYRVHQESETMRLRKRGEDLEDEIKAIPIILSHVPSNSRAHKELALRLISIAKEFIVLRRPGRGIESIVEALRTDSSAEVKAETARLCGWIAWRVIRGPFRR